MKNIFIFPFLLFLIFSCKKEDEDAAVAAIWVENINSRDTLVLDISKNEGYLILKRGIDTVNGCPIPKWGSGIYNYKISGDSIRLINGLSSCACWNNYYFRPDGTGNSILIGNFFKEYPEDPDRLIFIKI